MSSPTAAARSYGLPPPMTLPTTTRARTRASPRGTPRAAPVMPPTPVPVPVMTPPPVVEEEKVVAQEPTPSNDELLKEKGYIPIRKVMVKDPETNARIAAYLHVRTPRGNRAYVALDQPGHWAEAESDIVLVPSSTSPLPQSVKKYAVGQLGTRVSGAVFACDQGICAVTDDGTQLSEVTFVSPRQEQVRSWSGFTLTPLVTMSMVLANPEAVAEGIEESVKVYQGKAFEQSVKELKLMEQQVSALPSVIEEYERMQLDYFHKLQKSMKVLEQYFRQYNNIEVVKANQENFDILLFNIQKRNELYEHLLTANEEVAAQKTQITRIAETLKERMAYLQEQFKRVESVYMP